MALITEFWGLDGLLLLTLLITLIYAYLTRNFNYWKKRGVEQIPPVPLFGNFGDVMLLKKSSTEWFEERYKAFAPLPYVGYYIFDKPFLMIRDPELIKLILKKESHIFLNRNMNTNPNDTLGSATLVVLRDAKFKYLRAKLTPFFTGRKLREMFYLMLDTCNDLNTFFKSQNTEGDGVVLEMGEIFVSFMTDLIGTTVYGIRVNSLHNPDAEFKKHGRKVFCYTFLRSYEFFAIFLAPHWAKFLDAHFYNKENELFFRQTLWSILNERERSGVKRNDLIDTLIELRKTQTEEEKKIFEFDGDNLIAQALTFFIGGFETSSTVMTFGSYELAMDQGIQNKLRREIKTALARNNGELTYDLVTSGIPYLDMVIAEIQRLHPTIAFLERIPSHDYKIPGSDLILEKGIPVTISIAGLHMDEEYYAQPRRFNPENFSPEKKNARNTVAFLPFGDGPRNCIGQRYGLLQVKLGLITLLSNYEVLPCEKTVIPAKLDPKAVISSPRGGVYLKLRKIIE